MNPDTLHLAARRHAIGLSVLKRLVERHVAETRKPLRRQLLNDWEREARRISGRWCR